jgi:DNA-binding XRE family transcriptional regulator
MPITPEKLRELRESLHLSQDEAAKVVHVKKRTWLSWELKQNVENNRKIPEGLLELFCIKMKINYKEVDNTIHIV